MHIKSYSLNSWEALPFKKKLNTNTLALNIQTISWKDQGETKYLNIFKNYENKLYNVIPTLSKENSIISL